LNVSFIDDLLRSGLSARLHVRMTVDSPPRRSSLYCVFTGLVREVGSVASFDGGRLVVESDTRAEVGDSIAVDGVCLTVVENGGGRLAFDVVPETLARVKPFGEHVNLEPALRAGEPLGGHYVQGHVDGVGMVASVASERDGMRMRIEPPRELLRYLVEKGSIAVEGVSLTVAAIDEAAFEIALIPHTLEATTLGRLEAGDSVNLEADVLAKYVERLLTRTGGDA
jgi:riboflavin synthase